MKRAIKKLHSRRGASILLALFLMLVATMICAVIISAAATAANRVHDDRGEEQDLLSITSAGKLVVAYLNEHNAYKTVKATGDYTEFSEIMAELHGNTSGFYDEGFSILKDLTDNSGADLTMTISVPTDAGKMQPAVMQFKVTDEGDGEHFTLAGTLGLGTTAADLAKSPQKLSFEGKLFKDRFYDDGFNRDASYWGEGAEGEPIFVPLVYSATMEIVTWELTDLKLLSVK